MQARVYFLFLTCLLERALGFPPFSLSPDPPDLLELQLKKATKFEFFPISSSIQSALIVDRSANGRAQASVEVSLGARGGGPIVAQQAAVVAAGTNRAGVFREERAAEVVALHSTPIDRPRGARVIPCFPHLREIAPEKAPRQLDLLNVSCPSYTERRYES